MTAFTGDFLGNWAMMMFCAIILMGIFASAFLVVEAIHERSAVAAAALIFLVMTAIGAAIISFSQ